VEIQMRVRALQWVKCPRNVFKPLLERGRPLREFQPQTDPVFTIRGVNCEHVRVKSGLSVIPADKSKREPDDSFTVKRPNQRAAELLHDNEVHERSCVEIVPAPNVLLEFLQGFHLSNGFDGLNLYSGRSGSHAKT
jgi:hypothetical protein